jgi:hypothetical protein
MTWQLPFSFKVRGVSASASGERFVAWAVQKPEIAVFGTDGESVAVVRLPTRGVVLGVRFLDRSESRFEALVADSSTLELISVDSARHAARSRESRVTFVASGAVWTAGSWIASGGNTIHIVEQAGERSLRARRMEPTGAFSGDALLSVTDGVVLRTLAQPPFTIESVGPDTSVIRMQPLPSAVASLVAETDGAAVEPYMISLPGLRLSNGYLQVLSDLRSDMRVIVTYDTDGRVVRSRRIDAPIGFVLSTPHVNRLVAVRAIGAPEIVLYRIR